jgi:hypothetical protein
MSGMQKDVYEYLRLADSALPCRFFGELEAL